MTLGRCPLSIFCSRVEPTNPESIIPGNPGKKGADGCKAVEGEFFIDNLLVRIHFIIEMIWWTGLAPWEFEFRFPGSVTSTFLDAKR